MDTIGLTLRSKSRRPRPQISHPKPISGPLPANSKAAGPSAKAASRGTRERSGSTTSDLVKRRYSTRFNQPPDIDAQAPPVPDLSQVKGEYATDASRTGKIAASTDPSQPIPVDLKALQDPSLPVDRYVAKLLANASEDEIEQYQRNLRKLKNRTSTDLQQNVYQNRTQFIKISREAEKLRSEMRTLRGLMADLTAALGQTTIGNGTNLLTADEQFAKRKANRSSIANLESMWNVQLQALWKTVEGSQKFLPAVPGRHIVLETNNWVELDSATWKTKRPVHIVLLNDHLLIAAKKHKRVEQANNYPRGPIPTRLVAEDCWPLQDIDMIDLGANLCAGATLQDADDRGMANAITIRVGSKPFTYCQDKGSSPTKNELLAIFRKTVEDLRRTLRLETEAANKSTESLGYLGGRNSSYSPKPDTYRAIDSSRDRPEIRIDVDGKQQNFRWVEGQIDELDVDIALQRFEEAITTIERLRKLAKGLKGNAIAQDVINTKVEERAARLAGVILRALVDTPSFLMRTKKNVNWLTRLGFEDQAREAYLKARSDVMSKRVRACVFEGDLELYIFQISFVYFSLIKNTISIYQQCFPTFMTSACIKWAKGHLDDFNELLARQLYSVERGTSVWEKCMSIVHEHAELLNEVGVDFADLIPKDLNPSGNRYNDSDGGEEHFEEASESRVAE